MLSRVRSLVAVTLFTLFMLVTTSFSSQGNAGPISFGVSGNSSVNDEPVRNELCKVRNALGGLFSSLACRDISISYRVKGRFLRGSDYAFRGDASCPAVSNISVAVAIAPCEESNTEVNVVIEDLAGQRSSKKLTMLQAKYLCR